MISRLLIGRLRMRRRLVWLPLVLLALLIRLPLIGLSLVWLPLVRLSLVRLPLARLSLIRLPLVWLPLVLLPLERLPLIWLSLVRLSLIVRYRAIELSVVGRVRMEVLTHVGIGLRAGPLAIAFRAVALSGDRIRRCRSERERDQRECDSTHSKLQRVTAASRNSLSQN